MASIEDGLNAVEKLDFLLRNEVVWEVGLRLPQREPGTPGAPRSYPEWTWTLFEGCLSIETSARKVAAALRVHWPMVRAESQRRYPDRPDLWAPPQPPRLHHWNYAKLRLREDKVLEQAIAEFERGSARQAVEMGIADPNSGSLTHPHPLQCLTGDGKVITPLYRAKRNTPIRDKKTKKIIGYKKADQTALPHTEGGGNQVYGNKVVMISGRTPDWHSRMIVGLDSCRTTGGEAQVAVRIMERIRPHYPSGPLVLVYDGAPRGVHIRSLLQAGVLPISPTTAAKAETADTPRVEKSGYIEARTINGQEIGLYGYGGQIGIADFDADGTEVFVPLERLQIKNDRNPDGTYRWHGRYRLPASHGGGDIWVRADTTDADLAKKKPVNRSENFRLIPPGDPDYERLYGIRSDSEANNRQLEDTLWINRAHSNGAQAQLLDLLGYALLYNSIAIGLHRRRAGESPGLAQAA